MLSKSKSVVVVVSIVSLVLLSVGMSAPARAAEPETVKFMLNWLASGEHPAYFLAIERGFFAAEGLTVEITEGRGATETLKVVAQGTYTFGLADYSTMMAAIEKGMPVQGIFCELRTNPMAIISSAEQPIRTPRDLEGKILAGAPTIGPFQLLPTLLKINGADIRKVTIRQVPPTAQTQTLLQRQCDAIPSNAFQQVVFEQQGFAVYVMRYADFGVNPLAVGIVVNKPYLDSHGATVKAFLRAVSKGWHAALADPEAAVDALLKHYPERQGQRQTYLESLKQIMPFLQRSGTEGKPLGWTAPEHWAETQRLLLDTGIITQKLPLETYYTNDYIPTE